MKVVDIVGIRVEMPSNQPVLLLREPTSRRILPIWIGAVEATAIAFAQQDVQPPRPLTHDLLCELLALLEHVPTSVAITDLTDGVFYAQLEFADGKHLSARPSDAIAIALRLDTPVLVADSVLDAAAVEDPDGDDGDEAAMAAFREFLDSVSPEDFDSGGGESTQDG